MSIETGRRVLRIEAQALQDMMARLGGEFERAVEFLFACKGRVAVTGMGKSGIVARKISATLSSTGTPSFFLHPAEALHGDLGMLAPGDTMLAVSYGGETREIATDDVYLTGLSEFCRDVLKRVAEWAVSARQNQIVHKNADKLLHLYPTGHGVCPTVVEVGIPVLA